MRSRRFLRETLALITAILLVGSGPLAAQTQVKLPKNKFAPEQDVQLGQQAAAEVQTQYPVIKDPEIVAYLDRLGQRLVAAAPPELNNPAFQYSFTPVNLKEINAFALPGGPMFVNRGMFEAAATEGEVVGVMAHELSHVLLRHGTANITKSQHPGLQLGSLAGAIAGAVVGGGLGSAIQQGSQFGLGSLMLRYSRDFEKQADLLGAQIMARAGYDPQDLGRMFETIAKQGGSGSPQWLSSHPNPGNRSAYIAKEAAQLQVAAVQSDAQEFSRAKATFASLPAPGSMADVSARSAAGGETPGEAAPASLGTIGQPVPPPATDYRTMQGGQLFEVSVPSNWQGVQSNNAVKFVPPNAYGQLNGKTVFTHGVQIGVARAASRDLQQATRTLLEGFAKANPNLRLAGEQRQLQLSRRTALGTPLVHQSEQGRQELIGLFTTFLADGNLFYYLTIVPQDEAQAYQPAFQRVGQSIRITDVR